MDELQQLDIFSAIHTELDTEGTTNDVELTMFTKEKSMLRAKTGAQMGNGDLSANTTVALRNVLGRGEQVECTGSAGVKSRGTLQVEFIKPIFTSLGGVRSSFRLSAFQNSNDNSVTASHKEFLRGGRALYQRGPHRFIYEAVWRVIGEMTPSASMAVREQAGHSLKSALRYQYDSSSEDSLLMPTEGGRVCSTTEVAGLGGNVEFASTQLEARYSLPLLYGISSTLSVGGGVVMPLEDKPIRLIDRFFLGGPQSVRGTLTRGLGPSAARMSDAPDLAAALPAIVADTMIPHSQTHDALGGDTYMTTGLHVHVPVYYPAIMNNPSLRLHLFATAGSLINRRDIATAPTDLWRSCTATAGAGVAYIFANQIRLEFNYSVPLRASGATVQPWQLGFGISFN